MTVSSCSITRGHHTIPRVKNTCIQNYKYRPRPTPIVRHHYDEQICDGGVGKAEKWSSACTVERGRTGDTTVVAGLRGLRLTVEHVVGQ